jgi:hypothetical protein
MNKTRQNILVSGLGWSGSSALIDLFREYDNIVIVPGEFDDFRRPGLIGDLIESGNSQNIKSVITKSWRLLSIKRRLYYTLQLCFPFLFKSYFSNNKEKLRIQTLNVLKQDVEERRAYKKAITKIIQTKSQRERTQIANSWITELGDYYSSNADYIVYDQPIRHEFHSQIWPLVFHPCKTIFVYREPKDQLANIFKFSPWYFSYTSRLYGNETKNDVEFFCDVLFNRIQCIEKSYNEQGENYIMLISFEDLVQKYDESVSRIEKFLGTSNRYHNKKNAFFKPEESKNNIGIYKEYLKKEHYMFVRNIEKWYLRKSNET